MATLGAAQQPGPPEGGADGQWLTKAGSTDYTAAWAAPPAARYGPYAVTPTGQWISPNSGMVASTTSNPTTSQVPVPADTVRYLPFFLTAATPIDMIGVYSLAVAGATGQAGVLAAQPTTLLPGVVLAAGGVVAHSGSGAVNRPVSVTVPAGWNYLAFAAGPIPPKLTSISPGMAPSLMKLRAAALPATLYRSNCFTAATSGAALIDNPTVGEAAAANLPAVWLRAA